MSLWIKICGTTSLEDALMAAEAGADAVGFVFAPSPRRVFPQQVAEIIRHLPATLEKIGVFVDASVEEIENTVHASGLTGVQVHFDVSPTVAARLRQSLGPELRILRVLHYKEGIANELAGHLQNPHVDAVLVDSRTATLMGGTGIAFDWDAATRELRDSGQRGRIVVAGGLAPTNVAEAIAKLRPWGVDVVTGVEAAPGRKDPEKVRGFVSAARSAHEALK